MQAPGVKQVGKDPLPAIRRRLKTMAKKEQKVQRREEIRTVIKVFIARTG